MSGTKGKVLVAMSGGVDSSVAAALLLREGYEVVGCFMRLGSPGETLDELVPEAPACTGSQTENGNRISARSTGHPGKQAAPAKIGHQGCCSINDAADARLVAAELGVPFYVCNFKKDFGRIIDYFVDEYARGHTPNPCVRCNDWLKFGKLHEYAQQIGADFTASGHYARIVPDAHGDNRLMRAIDHSKDQSYVLFGAPRARLNQMMLPIGGMLKPHVRDLAKQFGLPVFDKPDSQEICFVPDNNYAGLVESRRPDLARSGNIVDSTGKVLGAHDGQHKYTIGQRRGVGIAFGHPIYVVGKDPVANTITVGEKEELLVSSCSAGEANWLVEPERLTGWFPCRAKYRYNAPAVPALAFIGAHSDKKTSSGRTGTFDVRFDSPQSAVAPGQAVVLYSVDEPDVVLGGGWIAST
ncbi:MAG: tRNA 2-thiouridine(34) synthase MnmA [Pyrinomonadaceae bacterium]|nr:tRNA 2-thiouridine(34) synthase MnmA [Phycisphaerales bacterium]